MPTYPSSARDAALKLLSLRDLTRQELRERLARRGFDQAQTDAAVEGLVRSRSVDDRRLAYNVILSRSRRMRLGRQRLEAELRRRGVSEEDLQAAWDSVGDGYDASALLREARDSLVRSAGPPRDRRGFDRLARQLARKGFPGRDVLAALEPLRPGAREFEGDRDEDEFRDP